MEQEKRIVSALDFFNGDELAVDVWTRKYKFKNEQNPSESFERYSKEIAEQEFIRLNKFTLYSEIMGNLSEYGKKRYWTLKNILNQQNTEKVQQEIKDYIKSLLGFDKILLAGSMLQGIGNYKLYSSLSNCFVLGRPYDSYSGISQKTEEIVQVMKRRGGAGLDLSSIRPEGATVHNQASWSSGPVLFAHRYSNITLEVAQSGRRGALMISINIAHPDALKFAEAKQDLTKLTGCNSSIIFDDDFMQAVDKNKTYWQHFPVDVPISDFQLDSIKTPQINQLYKCKYNVNDEIKTGYVKQIRAKEVWKKITEFARNTAEPGIIFEGNWFKNGLDCVYPQYRPVTTNPCFSGDTLVLTDNGYYEIKTLVGKKIKVWNGKQWSEVEPKITNHNQEMLKITLSDGSIFRCTKYHNWPIWKRDGKEVLTEAQNLSVGDKISKFNLPVIEGLQELSVKIAYTKGFYSGNGTTSRNNIRLYGEKIKCSEFMCGYLSPGSVGKQNNIEYIDFKMSTDNMSKDFVPDCNYTIKTRLAWLSGLIDADGCVDKQEGGGSCQICSTNYEFLNKIKLMLSTLGVHARLNLLRKEGYYNLPDQKGGSVNVLCKTGYRILINASQIQELIRLGLNTHRVDFNQFPKFPRNSSRFITIKSIEKSGIDENVYCFNEPLEHKAVFNGQLLGQCSEIPMQPYDSCRLTSVNLFGLVNDPFKESASISWEDAYKLFYEQLTTLDICIDLEIKYIQRIIDKIKSGSDPEELKNREIELWEKIMNQTKSGRRAGAGFTGLGDTLAALGLNYDSSKETTDFLNKIFSCKMKAEIDATTDMAILYGAFEGYNKEKEYEEITIYGNYNCLGTTLMYQMIYEKFPESAKRMMKFGRRNISFSTAAPTGSLSILSQTTSGIEPLFSPYYFRRKKCISENERVDYIDPADGQKFTVFAVLHPKFKYWIENIYQLNTKKIEDLTESELKEIFKKSPWYNNTANDINWKDRVIIQSIVQRYTTHAISSTINLPSDIEAKVVEGIYFESWIRGLKGNTIYRDGSRGGVLVTSSETSKNVDEFDETMAPKRPNRLQARYHTIKTKKKIYSVIIGLLQGKPYEVFVTSGIDNMPQNLDDYEDYIEGEIVKEDKNWYNFESRTFTLKEISDIEGEEKELSLMVSLALRHRTPLHYVIKTLQKTQPLIGSFTQKFCKILSKYIPDGTESSEKCPECGTKLRYENGCSICPNCGHSKCS